MIPTRDRSDEGRDANGSRPWYTSFLSTFARLVRDRGARGPAEPSHLPASGLAPAGTQASSSGLLPAGAQTSAPGVTPAAPQRPSFHLTPAHVVPSAVPVAQTGLAIAQRSADHLRHYASDLSVLGQAAPGVLRRIGRAVARDVAGQFGAGDMEEALLELSWHWRNESLGRMRVLEKADDGVALLLSNCWECRDATSHPHGPAPRRCALTSGFLEETVSRATGQAWGATELECRSAEGASCRWLLEREA